MRRYEEFWVATWSGGANPLRFDRRRTAMTLRASDRPPCSRSFLVEADLLSQHLSSESVLIRCGIYEAGKALTGRCLKTGSDMYIPHRPWPTSWSSPKTSLSSTPMSTSLGNHSRITPSVTLYLHLGHLKRPRPCLL